MAENNNNILSQLQDLLKNFKLNDLIRQAEEAKDVEVKAEEKQGGGLTDVLKSVTKGGGILGILKMLKMFKSLQGGKILGKLGKVAGLASIEDAADKFQNMPEDTEAQENMLDDLDMMVAVALEDGVITPEEEAMLSKKAEELGLNVPEFLAELHEKCAVEA